MDKAHGSDHGECLPLANGDVQIQAFGDEVVLYDKTAKRVHVLNRSAQFIWERCDGRTTRDVLATAMADAFTDAAPDVVERDIDATLARFRSEGLVAEAAEP
ncbi:MAG: PqqD family protein [bacterium]|nr:PqqD family protein [bacterium]